MNGIDYRFPTTRRCAPGGFAVLASNSGMFQKRYGFGPSGEYGGRLDNKGERIDSGRRIGRHADVGPLQRQGAVARGGGQRGLFAGGEEQQRSGGSGFAGLLAGVSCGERFSRLGRPVERY